jgi:hypothetical protein
MPSSGMLRRVALIITDISEYFFTACQPDDGGDTFLRNVGSYKNHTASHTIRQHFSDLIYELKVAWTEVILARYCVITYFFLEQLT